MALLIFNARGFVLLQFVRLGQRLRVLAGGLSAVVLMAVGASAASAAPLYPQCPPVGSNVGCSQLVVINPNGTATVQTDPAAPSAGYDGAEDTLIGVQNNSSRSISSINLASTTRAIFAFDQDGLCDPLSWPAPATQNTPPGCPSTAGFGATGYEGPGVSFSNISPNEMTGTANFNPAIQPGASAYFGLEEALQNGQLRSSQAGPIAGPITVRGGTVKFDLTCVGASPCNGKVKLLIKIKGHRILATIASVKAHLLTIGSLRISIPAGFTEGLVVHPNKAGKALLLTHRHGFHATIRVTIGGKTYTIGTVKLK